MVDVALPREEALIMAQVRRDRLHATREEAKRSSVEGWDKHSSRQALRVWHTTCEVLLRLRGYFTDKQIGFRQ